MCSYKYLVPLEFRLYIISILRTGTILCLFDKNCELTTMTWFQDMNLPLRKCFLIIIVSSFFQNNREIFERN